MPSEDGQGDLQPLAADLDDDRLAVRLLVLVGVGGRGEGLDVVDELGLDPAGVDRERVCAGELGGERRVGDHRAVERDGGGHALDLELLQRAGGALQGLLRGWRR